MQGQRYPVEGRLASLPESAKAASSEATSVATRTLWPEQFYALRPGDHQAMML